MDGKPEVIEELPSGRDKQLNAISPTTISEDKHMIKERRKPKQGKDSEEQNDKSLTESDCTRIKDKESGQEIKQQNQKSRVLEHHEHKLPAQKYESEKAIREKRRIREIRAFWERDKTIPSHKEKEVGINTNASGSGALKGLRESDKIKPTAERLPYGLDDQSKNTLRSAELRCAIVASKNERENSFEFGPACDVRKTERTLPADSEIHEPTKLAKASNIKPRVSATSASPEIKDKDRKETFKGKVGASSQQKPNFQFFSLKEKMNEKSKNQISNPSQFQSLRNFWDAGVKLQSSIDRGDVSLPNNTVRNNTSVTHERKSKEDKGRDNVSNQVLIQHQTQASEREKPEKLDSVICELPLGSLTLKGLKVTHAQNTDSVQPVKKPVISQPQEQMGLHKHEVKEPIEKSIVSTKEHPPRGSQKMQAGLQNLLRETSVCQPPELRVGMKASETMNNISQTNCSGESTSQQDISQSEEVNETAERSVAPPKVSGLSSALEKLMKEASEIPSPKPRRVDRTLQRTAEMQAKSTTYQHDGESQQEISESIQKSVAPSKVSGLSSALEKLQKEASETPPPKPKRVYSALNGTAEMQVKSTAYQHDGESQQEISESIEKSVAPPKVSGLSSALEKLLKETSETPPPKPKRVYNTERRTAEMQVERTAYLHDGESPREVSEFIERSVAPSKVSGLSSALEKLLKEASETPPPKPKDVDNTLHGTAEMQVKNTNYQCDGDSLQEISESVEKSVAPPKVSGLSSALEKLLKEASETPPPKPKRVDNTLHGTAEMQVKSTTYQHDGESLQEINEYIEKSVAPSKVSGLSSALEKLLKEASETPPPKPKRVYNTERRTAEMQVERTAYLHDGESPREVSEFIERSVAPSKVSGLSSALEKLLKEASETPPPKPKDVDNTLHGTAEMQVKNTNYQCDGDSLQEISESVEKSVAPPKVSGLSSALEKLLKEASETPPPKPKRVDRTLQRTAEMQVKSVTYQHNGASLPEKSGETTETSALSKAEYRLLDVNLQKLLKGVSETPGPMLENTDEKMHGKMSTSQSMCPPSQEERDHPREIEETIERTSVSDIAKFRDFSSSVERLLQEASEASSQVSREVHKQEKSGDFCMFPLQKESLFTTMSQPYHNALTTYTGMKTTIKSGTPEQNIEASVDTEASDILKRNGALNQKEQRNMPPIDLLPLEGETNTAVNKPFKVNARGRTDESTSSDASENNSESKELLRLRRTSTPLKDESNSPQPGGAQLCLAFQHEVTDEEDGYSSNLGSRFSDENSDSHSGTESSTRSEEELNPVLMALKRSADRKMPSKSLEDIPSATSNKGKIKIPKEELALSAEDVSTVPPQPDQLFSNPEKLKGLSKSVPSFLQEESDDRETDTASESSYSLGRIKKSPSSLTNLSGSSGMASLSSVSGSLMSVYSGDFGNVDVKGNIQFAIDYVEQLNELHIFICQCKDLAVADVKRQRSDPYVKTYLLPEKYKLGKRKTSVKKKTFNPVYNEILRYKIEKDLLKNQSLNISVWHNDTFGRNSFLGEVELDLGTWDWNDKSNKQINWFPLKPRTSTMALELENRGEMKLALKYVPQPTGGKKTLSTGEVHIWVKECHDLPPLRGNRLNSFIKCTILPDTSRKSRQKTRTVAKTTNPVFNHTMVYDGFRPEDLKEACIELTVWDHNKLANHFLGGLRIGLGTGRSYGTTVDWMDSTSDESALWEKMINLPNTWVEDTIPLRMLMVAKLTK
ncbi:synaptotagmin-like protein 2 isoform X3 [Anas acuta]|uniref:synaptotagmin-like protein 2 isoform X3 n=1 Tax=Anas acuta TaxID=28680 RepID=UPI0035C935CA